LALSVVEGLCGDATWQGIVRSTACRWYARPLPFSGSGRGLSKPAGKKLPCPKTEAEQCTPPDFGDEHPPSPSTVIYFPSCRQHRIDGRSWKKIQRTFELMPQKIQAQVAGAAVIAFGNSRRRDNRGMRNGRQNLSSASKRT
jgi:hypothetical protein